MAAHFPPEYNNGGNSSFDDNDDSWFDSTDSREYPSFDSDNVRSSSRYGSEAVYRHRHKRRHRGRVIAGVIIAVLAVVLVAGGASAFALVNSVKTVKAEASEAMGEVSTITSALKSGDSVTAAASIQNVQTSVSNINNEINSPLWNVAALVPVYGQDVKSAQTIGRVAEDLVDNALLPVSQSLAGVSLSNLFQDGKIDVAIFQSLADSLSEAAPVIQKDAAEVDALPEAHIAQVQTILDKVKDPLAKANDAVQAIEPAAQLLPGMLGANGETRTYLVIAQNNSELRATGGLPGSWGTLTITDGAIEMGEFSTVLHLSGLQVQLTDDEKAAIATNMDVDPAQVNCTADFTRVGELARDYWLQIKGQEVDGVVAMDPVFLQRLLSLTGGVTAADGSTVDGTNAAKALLSDTYWKFGNDGDAQDEYFSSVASLCFKQVMDNMGNADLTEFVDVITDSTKDGRLLAWMANDDEEALMVKAGCSGELADDPTKPVLGVYINDDTYSKIDWYAQLNTTIGEGVKNADGTTTYACSTVLTNNFTSDIAWDAPQYIYGGNSLKRDRSDMISFLFLYGPAGGSITDVQVSDADLVSGSGVAQASLSGLDVIRLHTNTLGGTSTTVTYNVTVSTDATEPLALRTTPLAQESN